MDRPDAVDFCMAFRLRRLGVGVLCVIGACTWDAPPVDWQPPTPLATSVDSASRFTARWTSGATPQVVIGTPADAQLGSPRPALEFSTSCPNSWVEASAAGGGVWSAWWQIRPDSSARLMAHFRDSLGATRRTMTVDSVDVAPLGCARPAPAIAVDPVNGYVHIGYYMVAPEGPGLFYVHLMDPKASAFEPPVAMVYGEKPVRVAIASAHDTVAVVYEDPNSEAGRIAMSMSFTAGHLWEQTARLIRVSTSSQHASTPQVVKLSGGELWLGWKEASQSGSAFLLRRARIVSR